MTERYRADLLENEGTPVMTVIEGVSLEIIIDSTVLNTASVFLACSTLENIVISLLSNRYSITHTRKVDKNDSRLIYIKFLIIDPDRDGKKELTYMVYKSE